MVAALREGIFEVEKGESQRSGNGTAAEQAQCHSLVNPHTKRAKAKGTAFESDSDE